MNTEIIREDERRDSNENDAQKCPNVLALIKATNNCETIQLNSRLNSDNSQSSLVSDVTIHETILPKVYLGIRVATDNESATNKTLEAAKAKPDCPYDYITNTIQLICLTVAGGEYFRSGQPSVAYLKPRKLCDCTVSIVQSLKPGNSPAGFHLDPPALDAWFCDIASVSIQFALNAIKLQFGRLEETENLSDTFALDGHKYAFSVQSDLQKVYHTVNICLEKNLLKEPD